MIHSGIIWYHKIQPLSPKLVTISPGGYKGYYLLGVTSYIREHFRTDGCLFSGASAGAWFSLMMTYRGNHSLLLQDLDVLSPAFVKQDLKQIQNRISHKLLANYKTEDFDLKRLFIGVSRFRPFHVVTDIYGDFRDLKDAIECCQASSHIPLITGGLLKRYDRRLTFDGGFSMYPYLNESEPILHISTDIWREETEKHKKWNRQNPLLKNIRIVLEQTTLFSKDKYNLVEMYWTGYRDTARNHARLTELFPTLDSGR